MTFERFGDLLVEVLEDIREDLLFNRAEEMDQPKDYWITILTEQLAKKGDT